MKVEYDLHIKIGDYEELIRSRGSYSKDILRGLKNVKKGISHSINELIHAEEENTAHLQE